MTDAVNWRLGEKFAFRGSGLGPYTEQDNLMAEVVGTSDLDRDLEGSSSKYALPFADGSRPVCRTISGQWHVS